MKSFKYLIQMDEGLHARPATLIVTTAKQYNSNIQLKKEDKLVDCKRMISIMSLNIKKNDNIEVIVNGIDEEEAVNALEKIFKENL